MENTETQNNQNETPEQTGGKVEKKFAAAIEKLTAVLNGAEKLKAVKKLPNDEVSGLVEELFKEERESLHLEVKGKLKELLKQYHELQKTVRQKEEELKKLEAQKKEEFVKAAQALFDKIQNVDAVKESYYDGLKAASETPAK